MKFARERFKRVYAAPNNDSNNDGAISVQICWICWVCAADVKAGAHFVPSTIMCHAMADHVQIF